MNQPRDRRGKEEPPVIRDLGDLCIQWPELRQEVFAALEAGALERRPEAIVHWLIKLADNVCTFGDPPAD